MKCDIEIVSSNAVIPVVSDQSYLKCLLALYGVDSKLKHDTGRILF